MSVIEKEPASEGEPTIDETWMNEIVWVKANEPLAHVCTLRVGASLRVVQMSYALGRAPHSELFDRMFYGRGGFVSADEIAGFSTFYATCDPQRAQNAVNVIDAGGRQDGNLSSAWIVSWGRQTIFGITPDGSAPMGRDMEFGVAIVDWRYACRVANLNAQADPEPLLSRALMRLPPIDKQTTAIYLNREHHNALGLSKFHGIVIREVPLRSDEGLVT